MDFPLNFLWRAEPVPPAKVAIVDVDGVISDAAQRQHLLEGPYPDWDTFFEVCGADDVIAGQARLLDLLDPELGVVLLTARPLRVRRQTVEWLVRHGIRWDLLVMRDYGDFMHSASFKARSLFELREFGFDPVIAFDDDPRNVEMFRHFDVPSVYIHSGYYE